MYVRTTIDINEDSYGIITVITLLKLLPTMTVTFVILINSRYLIYLI